MLFTAKTGACNYLDTLLFPLSPSLLFSKKNITNITFWGNCSVKCLFYSQLSMRHQGDVLGDVFSQQVMFWVMFSANSWCLGDVLPTLGPFTVLLNTPAFSRCSDWRERSFPQVGRSFPTCGTCLSHWRESSLHLWPLIYKKINNTQTFFSKP